MQADGFISLGGQNPANIDHLLAQMGGSVGTRTAQDYLLMLGKRSADMAKKRKPINQTPTMPKPYCRHKEFSRMPKYSLDRVSLLLPA